MRCVLRPMRYIVFNISIVRFRGILEKIFGLNFMAIGQADPKRILPMGFYLFLLNWLINILK